MVYISADRPLPLVEWQEERPAFYVCELDEDERRVTGQFTKPFVYYAGSYQGCGCGFSYGRWPVEKEEDKLEDLAARESVKQFSSYLRTAVEHGPVELYACWDGDQEQEPESRLVVTPEHIAGETFEFKKKQFLTITKA